MPSAAPPGLLQSRVSFCSSCIRRLAGCGQKRVIWRISWLLSPSSLRRARSMRMLSTRVFGLPSRCGGGLRLDCLQSGSGIAQRVCTSMHPSRAAMLNVVALFKRTQYFPYLGIPPLTEFSGGLGVQFRVFERYCRMSRLSTLRLRPARLSSATNRRKAALSSRLKTPV